MKLITMTVLSVLSLATTPALAMDRPVATGYAEYNIEADTAEVGIGAEFKPLADLKVTPVIVGFGPTEDFKFDRAELHVDYAVNPKVTVYVEVDTDDELRYDETTLGAAVRF